MPEAVVWKGSHYEALGTGAKSIDRPSSGVATRNPYSRDGYLTTSGGTVTAITINGKTQAWNGTTPIYLPANAVFTLTYTGFPTLTHNVT